MDLKLGHEVTSIVKKNGIFQIPTEKGKGILVTTTYHGNLMIGPNAQEVSDREDVSTDEAILKYIVETAKKSVSGFNMKKAITSFAGVRPTSSTKDFIIEETEVRGFINVAGIDSPGITSSPAIALKIPEEQVKKRGPGSSILPKRASRADIMNIKK